MRKASKYIAVFTAALLLASCGGKNEWTVNGKITGAEEQTMLLEANDNGRWYVLDSMKIDKSGNFISHQPAAGYPDIYRLRLGDKTLYFPIDSIETVTVVTNADAFDHEYTISGSESAAMLMEVDKLVTDAITKGGAASLAADTLLKRQLGGLLLGNPSGIVSYYIINKRIQGVPLFSPTNKNDLRIIGAVANAYTQFRPNDPRTRYLASLFLSNRPRTVSDTIKAEELQIIDMKLYDQHGKERSLADVASKNKVVLLNFTAYDTDFSPALNVELNRIYEKYRGQGFEIYQVSVDPEEFKWKQSAKNLPWISVYNSPADMSPLLNYNVGAVPAGFIISNGEIKERVTDTANLSGQLAKYM